jgi:hypothetical protein
MKDFIKIAAAVILLTNAHAQIIEQETSRALAASPPSDDADAPAADADQGEGDTDFPVETEEEKQARLAKE